MDVFGNIIQNRLSSSCYFLLPFPSLIPPFDFSLLLRYLLSCHPFLPWWYMLLSSTSRPHSVASSWSNNARSLTSRFRRRFLSCADTATAIRRKKSINTLCIFFVLWFVKTIDWKIWDTLGGGKFTGNWFVVQKMWINFDVNYLSWFKPLTSLNSTPA